MIPAGGNPARDGSEAAEEPAPSAAAPGGTSAGERPRRPPRNPPPAVGTAARDTGNLGLLKRLAVFLLVVGIGYFIVLRISHLLFAPKPEATRVVAPPSRVGPGEKADMAVMVHNRGWVTGAAFVVAVLGNGIEVEGPTVLVPPRDSVLVPVSVSLAPGEHSLSLVLFDSWRGIRRLETYRDFDVEVESRATALAPVPAQVPDRATRGDVLSASVHWTNGGDAGQDVVPVLVFRPEDGGPPRPFEGTTVQVPPGEETLTVTVDTWQLEAGRYSAEVLVRSPDGAPLGRGQRLFSVEIVER